MSETAKDLLRKSYFDVVDLLAAQRPSQYYDSGLDPYNTLEKSGYPDVQEQQIHIGQMEDAIKYSWEDEYKSINKDGKPKRPNKLQIKPKINSSYDIDEILNTYRELQSKQIGDIYLTGSIALHLQSKISRTKFKDLDIIVIGEYELDDDILDYSRPFEYPQTNGVGETKSIVFNNTPIDLFRFDNSDSLNLVEVERGGFIYLCQDYKDIVKVKFNMIIDRMKDSQELYGTCFDLKFN